MFSKASAIVRVWEELGILANERTRNDRSWSNGGCVTQNPGCAAKYGANCNIAHHKPPSVERFHSQRHSCPTKIVAVAYHHPQVVISGGRLIWLLNQLGSKTPESSDACINHVNGVKQEKLSANWPAMSPFLL